MSRENTLYHDDSEAKTMLVQNCPNLCCLTLTEYENKHNNNSTSD